MFCFRCAAQQARPARLARYHAHESATVQAIHKALEEPVEALSEGENAARGNAQICRKGPAVEDWAHTATLMFEIRIEDSQ